MPHPISGWCDGQTYGAARIPGPCGRDLLVIFSGGPEDEFGWHHVSVSLPNRCPNWPEMCAIKGLFWADEDVVVQFHPPKSQYVNNHPFCLHLWAPVGRAIELPPVNLVGTL